MQPQVSVGLAKQTVRDVPSGFTARTPGLHLGGGVLVGREFGRWLAESGLLYWVNKTGQRTQTLTFADQFDPLTGTTQQGTETVRLQERYQHLVLPLRIGYNLMPGSKVSLRPVGGVMLSYNTKHEDLFDTDASHDDDGFRDSHLLGNGLQKVSLWGNLGVQAQFAASRRLAVVVSGDAAYMLTPIADAPVQQRSLVLSFGMGLRGLL